MARVRGVPPPSASRDTANSSLASKVQTRRSARAALWLGLLASLLVLTSNFTANQANDCIAALLPAWKIAWHGTAQIPEFVGKNIWVKQGPWGALSNRLPGTILWAVPFYRLLGIPSAPSFFPAAIAAASAVSLGVAATYASMLRLVSRRVALPTVTLLALGTGVWTSAADALWTHGPNILWLGLAMWALSHSRWRLAGLALALAVLTRPHLAFAAATIGLVIAWRTKSWRPLLGIGSTSLLGVVGLLIWNRLVWHQWALLTDNYAGQADAGASTLVATSSGSTVLLERTLGTLISPNRGMFIYSPFLLLLLPGIRLAWRAAAPWVRGCAVGGVVYMVVQLVGNGFGGGDGFTSYRLAIEMVALATPLLSLCWVEWTSRERWRRAAFAVLAWIAVGQHAMGAFVGHDDHVVRDPWRSYSLAARLPEASPLQLVALIVFLVVAAAALWQVAQRGAGAAPAVGTLAECHASRGPLQPPRSS